MRVGIASEHMAVSLMYWLLTGYNIDKIIIVWEHFDGKDPKLSKRTEALAKIRTKITFHMPLLPNSIAFTCG